ncbi:response regulator receiver modulated diguanylate cyclase/phosphodiesterase with PAS/PAC sensor(s) [Pseudodesulfovibrio mercurii]|uniref:Response regulator receiver modulated diguanylate cyclase/phosphodiesterase with PAS/PAC sensor(S) n=1 Tax=Pseudodesulfovibrio mercurii TaxID=641491 RepID=F0JEX7_9BACT|nr:EAL domain-containing protein [Pseudodesulfovibrio mercurii]EGB13612.1 response regulator receiver modulated diguanylate cyclase/phosphodiesterase with PAS/PAC sensor(s) [Pseudodesulfovibrio mercurii]
MSEIVDVLVVDDERINLKLVEGILRGQDLNLVTAMSGAEALNLLPDHDFAVALLDVMMPGMDGFELAERLRGSEATRNIPIIFITAISKEQRHVFHGYELGAVDYLFKPVEPEILRGKTNIFAELHRHKRSLMETTRRLEATVAELEASREALARSEQRYRMVADYNYDWESWIGPNGSLRYISPSCERISGYSPQRFLDEPDLMQRIVHREDLNKWVQFMQDDTVGDEESLDFRIGDINAKTKWLSLVRHSISSDKGEPLGLRLSMRDITNRKLVESKLQHSNFHDPLTGLPNRTLFLERLNRAAERCARSGEFFAVLFINMDRFQAVNDHYGHSVGDKLMVRIGVKLQQTVRPIDTVARFGSDEFGVLIEDMPRRSDVRPLIRLIFDSFREPVEVDGITFTLSASIGYDVGAGTEVDTEEVLHNAQVAMNEAKEEGKNRVTAYDKRMREGMINVLAVESELNRALVAGEFTAHYQPIVNLADGSLYGFEALARWNHPERGLVSPGEFIPVAEETGQIVTLGSQILEEACTAMQEWTRRYPAAENLTIAVNISAKQFAESSLAANVERVLKRTGLRPGRLKLEITETVVMLDAIKSVNQLKTLKNLGILLSIDDFGTGYSSMSYLQRFPTDQLKIDLSFVQRMESSPENIEIIRAIVNMAHSLRLRVVAEGIETERQRDLLYSLQCDYGQGYLYSRPLPREQAEDFVKDSK